MIFIFGISTGLKKYCPAKIYSLIYALIRPKKEKIFSLNNFKIIVPPNQNITQKIAMDYVFEPLGTKAVKDNLKSGMTFLDIGSHIGYYTLLASSITNGLIYSFEPDDKNFDILLRNIKLNNFRNVIPIKKAVSDFNGKIKFYIKKDSFWHSTVPNNDTNKVIEEKEIDCISLDNHIKKKIDFVKIDVEGGEVRALRGMSRILKDVKIILVEYNPNSYTAKEFFDVLQDFKIYRLQYDKDPILMNIDTCPNYPTDFICYRK